MSLLGHILGFIVGFALLTFGFWEALNSCWWRAIGLFFLAICSSTFTFVLDMNHTPGRILFWIVLLSIASAGRFIIRNLKPEID